MRKQEKLHESTTENRYSVNLEKSKPTAAFKKLQHVKFSFAYA